MLRAFASIVLVVLFAVSVAGCGKADRVEYERNLAKVGRIVDRSLEQLPDDDAEPVGPDDIARIAGDLREAADQLADLTPPADARDAQDQLEQGLRGVADALDRLADDLASVSGDGARADLFVKFAEDERVDRAFDDLVAAQEAYDAEGYRVFGTPPEPSSPAGG